MCVLSICEKTNILVELRNVRRSIRQFDYHIISQHNKMHRIIILILHDGILCLYCFLYLYINILIFPVVLYNITCLYYLSYFYMQYHACITSHIFI